MILPYYYYYYDITLIDPTRAIIDTLLLLLLILFDAIDIAITPMPLRHCHYIIIIDDYCH
jgi:hypothetical protein